MNIFGYYLFVGCSKDHLIKLIDLTGGPTICINEDLETSNYSLHINQIKYKEANNCFIIYTNINDF